MPFANIGFKGEHGRARQRLALARQAGYLGANPRIPASDPEARAEWIRSSKHLSEDAREEGYTDPRQYLYAEVQKGGQQQGRTVTQPLNIAQKWSRIILTYGPGAVS